MPNYERHAPISNNFRSNDHIQLSVLRGSLDILRAKSNANRFAYVLFKDEFPGAYSRSQCGFTLDHITAHALVQSETAKVACKSQCTGLMLIKHFSGDPR